jgi:RNase adapter protein RapZ
MPVAERELVVITGMSGAGRSTVAHTLEDLGWYVVDNLPPSLLPSLFELSERSANSIAIVIDVRGREFFDDLSNSLSELAARGISRKVLFVDAADDVLVRRFESTRRPHPLQGNDRIVDGIAKERERLREVRSVADIVIDSSALNIHQLDRKIVEIFSQGNEADLKVNILSFGYKFGIPVDADLVMDCRFIPNPHWIPELRPLNGLDDPVSKNVLAAENVSEFLDKYQDLFETMSNGFISEGRKFLTLGVGCTGGKHRSVAIAAELARRLNGKSHSSGKKISAIALHRDLGKEI